MGLCLGTLLVKEERPSSLWSDLPVDLAGLVLCRLLSLTDRLSFRAVCRQWRLAAKQQHPLPPALPCLRLNYDAFLSLPDGQLHYCASVGYSLPVCISDGCLLCLRSRPARLFLTIPFSQATIELLLPDNCVNSLSGFFAMAQLRKMVVCSRDLVAAIVHDSDVCFYRPGAPSWLVCPYDRRGGQYVEIAFHHDKLYALTTREDLFAFEAGDSEAVEEVSRASHVEHAIKAEEVEPPATLSIVRRYLVMSSDNLLMVKLIDHSFHGIVSGSHIIKKIEVKVFETELTMGQWVEVKRLDDGQALFVSGGCSKAMLLSGQDHEIYQGNRVYFVGVDLFPFCSRIKRCDIPNYCFYDMSTGTSTAVFFRREVGTKTKPNRLADARCAFLSADREACCERCREQAGAVWNSDAQSRFAERGWAWSKDLYTEEWFFPSL